jgi:hypothetical protein
MLPCEGFGITSRLGEWSAVTVEPCVSDGVFEGRLSTGLEWELSEPAGSEMAFPSSRSSATSLRPDSGDEPSSGVDFDFVLLRRGLAVEFGSGYKHSRLPLRQPMGQVSHGLKISRVIGKTNVHKLVDFHHTASVELAKVNLRAMRGQKAIP